jgi:hypothetical protein
MVFRLRPVSRFVERIEQPSKRHRIARSAALGRESMVSRVSFVWGSQNVELQEEERQRLVSRLPKYPNA